MYVRTLYINIEKLIEFNTLMDCLIGGWVENRCDEFYRSFYLVIVLE